MGVGRRGTGREMGMSVRRGGSLGGDVDMIRINWHERSSSFPPSKVQVRS